MERRFTVEAEIEILKDEVSVLKAICKDLKMSMQTQEDMKEHEKQKKNELARKTKTLESQALEICHSRNDHGGHDFIPKGKSTTRGVLCWKECCFCGEEELTGRKFYV